MPAATGAPPQSMTVHAKSRVLELVYLDGAQPTLTMQSSVSDFAKDQIWAGLRPMFSGQYAILLATNAYNTAVGKVTSECAKPSFNFTANLQKWF